MPPEIATRVSPAAARLPRGHCIGKSYRQLLFLSSSPKWAHTIPSRSSLRRLFWGDVWSTNSPPNSKKGQPAWLFGSAREEFAFPDEEKPNPNEEFPFPVSTRCGRNALTEDEIL